MAGGVNQTLFGAQTCRQGGCENKIEKCEVLVHQRGNEQVHYEVIGVVEVGMAMLVVVLGFHIVKFECKQRFYQYDKRKDSQSAS